MRVVSSCVTSRCVSRRPLSSCQVIWCVVSGVLKALAACHRSCGIMARVALSLLVVTSGRVSCSVASLNVLFRCVVTSRLVSCRVACPVRCRLSSARATSLRVMSCVASHITSCVPSFQSHVLVDLGGVLALQQVWSRVLAALALFCACIWVAFKVHAPD